MSSDDFFLGPRADAPKIAAKMLGTLIEPRNGATVTVLHVPAGASYEGMEPIRIHTPSAHLLVILERGASAHLAVWIDAACRTHTAEVMLADEAEATLLTVHAAGSSNETSSVSQRSLCGSGSTVRWQNVTLAGGVEHDLISRVEGRDGTSSVDWMFYAKDTEEQSLDVRNVFDGEHGGGEILMRGIAEGKGYARCRGLIDIGLHGGGTNTYLTQEVLMLDPTSKVDAVPSLEIKTNDVKASHSATVARVTEEDLFYFGARGIDPREARRMFVLGFLGDITARIASDALREEIVAAIEGKYGA